MKPAAIATCVTVLSACMAAAATPTTSLPALRQQYESATGAAQEEYGRHTADKPGQYVKAIETLEAERRQTGDLEAVVALRQERAHFLATTNVIVGEVRIEHPDVRKLKQQYLRQLARSAGRRDLAIAAAAQAYTNQLALLKMQLTRAGRTGEALLVQDEMAAVRQDPRVQAATLSHYTEEEPPEAVAAPTSPPPVAVTAAVSDPLSPARLMEESVVSFRFTDTELDAPAELLSRLALRCLNHGVRLRVAAARLNVKSVLTEGGVPKFVLGPRPGPTHTRGRVKTYTFDSVPLRTVLQAFCAGLELGYAIDSEKREIVLVDAQDPKSAWSADPAPQNEILQALQGLESRRQHIGRALLATGEVAGTLQGLNEFILTLKDGTRLALPATAANRVRFERIRNALGAAGRRESNSVEVTALATIRPESSAQGLTLGDAVLLEVWGAGNYAIPVSVGPLAPQARPIHRLGE